jgi:hypothetical protein
VDPSDVLTKVEKLIAAAESSTSEDLKLLLAGVVPEFQIGAVPPPLPPVIPFPAEEPPRAAIRERVPDHTALKAPSLGDRAVSAIMLATIGLPLVVGLGLRRLLGPREVHLVREVRIGRDRRAGERRRTGGWSPIDRRFNDRRRRNLGGMPYTAYRIRFQPYPRSRWLRRLDRLLRALGSEAVPGFVNVLRGNATLTDLYPGRLAPEQLEEPVWGPAGDLALSRRGTYRHHASMTESRRGETK